MNRIEVSQVMRLSKKAIDDFKIIYFEEFKVELTNEEANVKGLELLNFIKLIYKPMPIKEILVSQNQNEKP
ncbi:hypothetical protein CO058_02105 [candidate division WWE3 bacterium CG_4_9_14_0_2_um_filter_35_11]|uniref:Uncharacterized protein n=1 Tax=candidate division WWE3 bacterium CG_4_9_14_0_2_um_filter_35_11 TaxID=1975077 RepID=A0A2M8ELV4_UNCKA|nr:MAG: hypothetical protein COV25_04265 [candidate division WWE3 bacterium CG10_big_fil_rev_8_21_14_0_10_35_32]PJC23705.1 MAG: hypothetical protein CO058_02105 [candidate division WWE3 bacterium CG_4_9_14_0_2_um_filter_35_11]